MPLLQSHRRLCSAVFLWGLLAGSVAAQAPDRPPDNATAARIADGVEKVQAGKLLDAVEQFQRVLDTAGDELVPVDRHQQIPARWVVHGHLARLPAEGIKLYRQRVDGQAAKRLAEVRKNRDDDGLQQLLADMFVARATEDAIVELARRSFERAEFDAAEHYWQLLLPPVGDDDLLLRFPNPKTTPAAVRAHLILLKLFRGDRDEGKSDLKTFRQKYADAAGLLAGKTGKYADTLTELLADPARTTLPRPPEEPGWLTFAGSAAREGTTRARLPYFWPDEPAWHKPLPFKPAKREDSPDPLHPRALAFHPVITDGRAYIADGGNLIAIDLMTGKSAAAGQPNGGQDTLVPTRQDIRYTLTEADGILYARFGPAALRASEPGEGPSFILALGARKGASEERDALWRLDPPTAPESTTHFEGAPAVHRGRLYVGFWRSAGAEALAGVASYRLDDPKSPPDLVWQRTVGKAGSEPNGETRYRHALVTISGPNVVYCTDGGTVIALDALTGRPAWEYRYPRNERPAQPRYRDLCPPLADGGRIYAAPADTDRLLCLDAFTGRLIWEREGVEVVHLLGVAKGRLIATFGGQVRGIRGLNLRTGADSGAGGWTIHDDGGEQTFGRGLVTDEVVVWPTKHGLRFLDPGDGTQLRLPIPGPFGNLCYADGVLLVTTATEMWAYVSEAKKVGDRRKAVEREPDNPVLNVQLTQSLIDAGRHAEAEKAATKAGEAKDRLIWLLAEKMIREGDRQEAKRLYEELAKGDGSFAAAGAVRIAEMNDDPTKTREAWRTVYAKRGSVQDERGIPYSADAYAEKRFGHPLYMRSIEGGNFDAHGPPRPTAGLVTSAGFTREQSFSLDDPTLSILSASRHGVLASGSDTYFFSCQEARRPQGVPDGATMPNRGPRATPVSASGLSGFSIPNRLGPRITRLDRPSLPVASNSETQTNTDGVRMDGSGLSFIHDGRLIVSRNWAWPEVEIRDAGEGHTAGICDNYRLGAISVAQRRDGKMLIWNRDDPRPREVPCTQKPWPEQPVSLEDDRFLLPDDGAAIVFDAKAGKELAHYKVPGPESLTGGLPRFRIHQDDVLLLIDRNYGTEVDRLRIDGLKRVWDRSPMLVGRELDDVTFADDRFFTSADGMLAAHSWKDGSLLWEFPLANAPHTHWRLSVSPQGLLVHPAEALLLNPQFDAVGEFRRAGWDRDHLLRAVARSYDVWTARELPVLVVDPADGRLIQRLTFPAAGPAAGVAVTPRGVVVVTGRGSWTLAARN